MKLLRTLALVLAASFGAVGLQQVIPYARAAMWNWSTTASSNATADPSINWSEGMSPSSVNDSARAMMAVLASWRNDLGAVTATTGTSTAYALTSNQGGFVANAAHDGFMIGFVPNVTNGAGGTTINVDSTSAKPLRAVTSTALPSGALVSGSKYTASYKFSTDEWLLLNSYASQFEVPLGAMIPFTGDFAPNANFVIPGGQCISRTTYAAYFSLVGTRFSTCDGVTTFGVPDMRSRTPLGLDNLNGSAAGRITFCTPTSVGVSCGSQSTTVTSGNLPVLTGIGSASSTFSLSATSGANNFLVTDGTLAGSGAGAAPRVINSGTNQASVSGTISTTINSVTVNTTGTSQPFSVLNPSLAVSYLLRVL